MIIFDTHFHLDNEDSPEEVIGRARAAGVELMNLISCDINDTVRNIKIAEDNNIYTTSGVHPLHIDDFDGDFKAFLPFFEHERVIGVGEIGLDYFYHKEEEQLERQRNIFTNFLKISAQTGKPAIIHCRDAFEDCYEMIKENLNEDQPFIIHCYTGDQEWAKRFVELGAYISYSGIVTFKNAASLRDSIKAVPHERILIETDSPYLAPVPHRGKRNEPANVVHVLERMSFELGLTQEETALLTVENSKKVFGLV
jgi:TatD DNase family protein